MTPQGLMIDDWVWLNYEGLKKAVRIIRLHQHYADVVTENDNEIDSVTYSLLEPIPLADEILKVNGFERVECVLNTNFESETCDRYALETEDGMSVCIDWQDSLDTGLGELHEQWMYIIYGCEGEFNSHVTNKIYVHELQHTLRLCGLNDLANNFKLPQHG